MIIKSLTYSPQSDCQCPNLLLAYNSNNLTYSPSLTDRPSLTYSLQSDCQYSSLPLSYNANNLTYSPQSDCQYPSLTVSIPVYL